MDINVVFSMVYNFFNQKTSGSGIKNKHMLNNELAEELQITNTIIRKFNKRKIHSTFRGNIWVLTLSIRS